MARIGGSKGPVVMTGSKVEEEREVGKGNTTVVKPKGYLQKLRELANKHLIMGALLRNRVTQVLPREKIRIQLITDKPSRQSEPAATKAPLPSDNSDKRTTPARVNPDGPERTSTSASPVNNEGSGIIEPLPRKDSGKAVITGPRPSSVADQPDSVSFAKTNGTERSHLVRDEFKVLVVAANQFIDKHASFKGETTIHLDRQFLQKALSDTCQEMGITDLSVSTKSLNLFKRFITQRLEEQGVKVVPYETRNELKGGEAREADRLLQDKVMPETRNELKGGEAREADRLLQDKVVPYETRNELKGGEAREADRLLQDKAAVVDYKFEFRPHVEAAAMPEEVLAIKKQGMQAKKYSDLAEAKKQYYKAVLTYCKEHYDNNTVPTGLQEAFYRGMVELVVHGAFLEKTENKIKGANRLKPKRKLRLATEAAAICEIRDAKDKLLEGNISGGEIGSTMNNLTDRGLISDRKDADYLFGHCMGFKLESGKELSLPLKGTLDRLEKVTEDLKTAPQGSKQRTELETRRTNQLNVIAEVRGKMADLESQRKAGLVRSNDDLWYEVNDLLGKRLTEHLQESVEAFHRKAGSARGKAGFLSEDVIVERFKPQLEHETHQIIFGSAKKTKVNPELQGHLDQIVQKKSDEIKHVLQKAIAPLKARLGSRK